eukprot:TRINITY_DN30251_c0_g2_i1.p1 TRINITY_DN30251_c0_g2~~TRINITY_DN30251_c0_g2_i1.p1  ORF type:complete len:306 (-),score=34.07 TRINITY_DN30251_c0_g2_i1:317-1177(-)
MAFTPIGLCFQRPRIHVLVMSLLLQLALPTLAYEGQKRAKFLAAYPTIFKFCLFWWCVFVFFIMAIYIADHLMFKKFGPARVTWKAERLFRGPAPREKYWAQLADPSKWSSQHLVLQSADLSMVNCKSGDVSASAPDESAEDIDEASAFAQVEPEDRLQAVELGPLKPGLGMILRHKADSGPRAGSFFCTREVTNLEQDASDGPWLLVMKTVEAGAGYPFLPNTEISEVEMFPAAEDGTIRCKMVGTADVNSRVFRWWTSLQKTSQEAAFALLESIDNEVSPPKST